MNYFGEAQVVWTPYQINIADFGSPPILIGYGQESIKVKWSAIGQADPSASDFVLDHFTLSGTVHVDNVFGVPAANAPPPFVCEYDLNHIPGAKLHVHHFPEGGLTLSDLTGGGFTGRGNGADDPLPPGDTWRADFPLASQYVQVNNDKPDCDPSLGMIDWTVSRVLPNYPRDETWKWVDSVTAWDNLVPDDPSTNQRYPAYDYSGPYGGALDVDPQNPLPPLTNAKYSIYIRSTVVLDRRPAGDENPFLQ